ncbi:MAG: outer membrane protein assembly factor BamD [Candidatus Omnitrophica bacterium]|nr:outer membrane protein assembly factor BamD [Candidatus Omnitrophota bacterium]
MRKIVLVFVLIFFNLSIICAYPYWIWTPKTGRWVNPKTAVRATSQEQFEFAKGLYEEKRYPEARREFKKLIKVYPKTFEAAEAQYYLGLIDEQEGNLYEAYLAYQKVIDKYPFSERIQEIIEREFKIAEAFMSGKKRKYMGMSLPVENPAIEIFTKVIENSTYGPLAPKAQYKLGLLFKSLGRYYEAEEAFSKVISNYPNSEWVTPAKFQIASCYAAISKGTDYDQGSTKEAKEKFEEFIIEYPDAVLSNEAEKSLSQLREKEAKSNFNIARFYEKQKDYAAAKIYYEDIIENYPQSIWAAKAMERLSIMEKR